MADHEMDGLIINIDGTSANANRLIYDDVSLARHHEKDTANGREGTPMPAPSFGISYTIQNHSFSGLKVDQLKVLGDVMYKPFKGVRMAAKAGKMEVRW